MMTQSRRIEPQRLVSSRNRTLCSLPRVDALCAVIVRIGVRSNVGTIYHGHSDRLDAAEAAKPAVAVGAQHDVGGTVLKAARPRGRLMGSIQNNSGLAQGLASTPFATSRK